MLPMDVFAQVQSKAVRRIMARRKSKLIIFMAIAFFLFIIYNLSNTEHESNQNRKFVSFDKKFDKYFHLCPSKLQIEDVFVDEMGTLADGQEKKVLAPEQEETLAAQQEKKVLVPEQEETLAAQQEKKVLVPEQEETLAAQQEKKVLVPEQEETLADGQEKKVLVPEQEETLAAQQEKKVLAPEQEKTLAAQQEKKVLVPEQEKTLAAQQEKKVLVPEQEKETLAAEQEKETLAADVEQEKKTLVAKQEKETLVAEQDKEKLAVGQNVSNEYQHSGKLATFLKRPAIETGTGHVKTSNIKAQEKQPIKGNGNKETSNIEAQAPYTSSPTVDNDDILNNISFATIMHVSESKGLNQVKFLNWTKTYMYGRHKNSFQMPEWFVKGAEICDNETEMIIIMPAVPDHYFTREVVRQTWASFIYGMQFPQLRPISLRTKLAFVFGTTGLPDYKKAVLKREGEQYNDVVAADFVDSYRNLSLKMMVGLNWVNRFCSSAKYVLKADLDTFINVPLLSRFLLEVSKKVPHFIIGHKHGKRMPPVLRSGKWGVDKKDYPFENFPPYLFGHSYVITGALVPLFVVAGKHMPLIPTEDAHITGVLARVIQAPRLHYKGFAYLYKKVLPCELLYNYEVSATKMSISRLMMMWRDMLTQTCSERELPIRSNSITRSEFDNMVREDEEIRNKSIAAQLDHVEDNFVKKDEKPQKTPGKSQENPIKQKEPPKQAADDSKSVWKSFWVV